MKTLVMAMTPERALDVCNPAARARLEERFHIRWASENLDSAELQALLPGSDVVVTSWGTPHIDVSMVSGENSPKIIAHAAGSIKHLVPQEAFELGVTVFSAAARIAESVGEYCLAATLTVLRQLPAYDQRVRQGEWQSESLRGRELRGQRIGIVGASSTAKAFIRLLKPFHCDIAVYDPYLSEERAAQLGVRLAGLDEVAEAPIVSLHVPALAETDGMFTAAHLASMPDGGILLNSSRGPALDYSALTAELESGRLFAALDVFPHEPPTLAPELSAATNVLLTPHVAGDSVEGHAALVGFVLDDVLMWLDSGRRGPSFVDPAVLATSA